MSAFITNPMDLYIVYAAYELSEDITATEYIEHHYFFFAPDAKNFISNHLFTGQRGMWAAFKTQVPNDYSIEEIELYVKQIVTRMNNGKE